jgi:hypothetical protein
MSRAVAASYEAALETLYRAPLDEFVAVRKRLCGELAAAGDKASAAILSKATRPPISAWVVNQLWWHERKAFDELFSTAERLRDADADAEATAAHREAITALRTRAARLLTEAGKTASESTLRRVTLTLTALAASGGFDPDPPGGLKGDRDPPGFEVAGLMVGGVGSKIRSSDKIASPARNDSAIAKKRQADELEERRLERERAHERAERERIERKLRIAREALDARREDVSRLKEELAKAEAAVEAAREVVRELEKELGRH